MKLEKILAIAAFIMIVTVAVWAALRPDLIPRFNLVLLAGLIAVTTIYAYSTIQIARASKEQAEEMREQRYIECLPLLVPNITRRSIVDLKLEPNEIEYQILQTGMEVTWQNLGKGVAIDVRFSFWSAVLDSHPGKSLYFSPRESNALGAAAKESISFEPTSVGWGHQLVNQTKPRLEAKYQDIYERKITTVQEFRIEEQNKNKRVFLGDLYFTVNGKRLGHEVTQHD